MNALHARSIVIDAVSPLLQHPRFLPYYIKGGVTAVCPTIAIHEHANVALARIGEWHRIARELPGVIIVRTTKDIERAKQEGAIAIIPHFQNIGPIEGNLDLVDGFAAAGVKVVQIAYNERGLAGDGCEEPSDAGLSRFGRTLIERLEACRVVVDCSHTGAKTTREAIAQARRPIVVSHANANAVRKSLRNLDDDVIRAIADKGGLVGAVAFPPFISATVPPRIGEFAEQIAYMVKVGGADHVGLGLDYYDGGHPFSSDEQAMEIFRRETESGRWSSAYPAPPWKFPAEIATPDLLPHLTDALQKFGLRDSTIEKVLGLNWMRVYREVWGA
jgi:membrane dipeptidase